MKKQLKKTGTSILNSLSGCLVPLIPVLIAAAMFKTVLAILGPNILGWLSTDNDLYILFDWVADAGFYFLPIYAGYTSASYFGMNGLMGAFLGAILVHPTFTAGPHISIFSLSVPDLNYASTILPILLSCWIMKYVYKLVDKILPDVLKDVFCTFLTILIMLPVTLCLIGPLGTWAGTWLCDAIMGLGSLGGIALVLSMGVIGATWQFIVMAGMHWIFITTIITLLGSGGVDQLIFPSAIASSFAVGGMCLGTFFALRNKEEKAKAMSYVVAQLVGGVTEPGLYGVGFQYKKPLAALMIGGAAGAIFSGLTGVTCTNLVPVASFLMLLNFPSTVLYAAGSALIGFTVSAAISYFIMK